MHIIFHCSSRYQIGLRLSSSFNYHNVLSNRVFNTTGVLQSYIYTPSPSLSTAPSLSTPPTLTTAHHQTHHWKFPRPYATTRVITMPHNRYPARRSRAVSHVPATSQPASQPATPTHPCHWSTGLLATKYRNLVSIYKICVEHITKQKTTM